MELTTFRFLLLQCLAGAVFVTGNPPNTNIGDLCGGGMLTVSTAEKLNANSLYLRAGSTCTVRVRSTLHSDPHDDKLRMEVLSLGAPCGEAFLQLFDGNGQHGAGQLSGKMCGDISYQQTMFRSSEEDFITVTIHRYTTGFVSLSLLATATSYDYKNNDFICDNLWVIDKSLQCDGYNNCGDWSDEHQFFCNEGMGRWPVIVIIACSWTVFFIVLACVIGFVVRRRRRRLQLRNLGTTTPIRGAGVGVGVGRAVPAYGSLQTQSGGVVYPAAPTTTFLPAPPPYSTLGATSSKPPADPRGFSTGPGVSPTSLPPPPPYSQQCVAPRAPTQAAPTPNQSGVAPAAPAATAPAATAPAATAPALESTDGH